MNGRCGMIAAAALISAGLAGAPSNAATLTEDGPVQTPETTIRSWPSYAQDLAKMLIVKYGEPDDFSEKSLVWLNNAPWKKTVLFKTAPRRAGASENDLLEQTISYQVPRKKVRELKRFNPHVSTDQVRGELSCVSDSESMNFLALNLADEIVAGRRTADEARDFYRRTVQIGPSGKSSAYTTRFLFEVRNEKAVAP